MPAKAQTAEKSGVVPNDRVAFTPLAGFWKGVAMKGQVTSLFRDSANVRIDGLGQVFRVKLKQVSKLSN